MELSKRLQAVAGLVTAGSVLADIGTDHAYIPIWLAENGRIRGAVAMDVNRGPLDRAEENIREHGLEDRIRTRLSDAGGSGLRRDRRHGRRADSAHPEGRDSACQDAERMYTSASVRDRKSESLSFRGRFFVY